MFVHLAGRTFCRCPILFASHPRGERPHLVFVPSRSSLLLPRNCVCSYSLKPNKTYTQKSNVANLTCRERFLLPCERITFTTLVKKHKGFSSKKRQLILTNTPRLLYVDPVKMVLMGTIPWTSDLSVRVESPCNFNIWTVSILELLFRSSKPFELLVEVYCQASLGRRYPTFLAAWHSAFLGRCPVLLHY